MIFKSPLVSTVRRSARYDCVTVVTPGRRRPSRRRVHVFLGLITDAEDGTVGRVPVVRRRIAEILLRSRRARRQPHRPPAAGRAAHAAPRRAARGARPATCCGWPSSSSTGPSSGTVGVFARMHLNRDFVTVLVYFPADRFGPRPAARCAR